MLTSILADDCSDEFLLAVTVSESKDDIHDPQPSTSGTQPHAVRDCHTGRQNLLQRAPVVPYGSDLYFWGDNFELPLVTR